MQALTVGTQKKKTKVKPEVKPIQRIGVKMVPLADLTKEFYVRQSLNQDRILMLAMLMENQEVDPITISEEKEVIDGRHRIEAALLLDRTEIACRVKHFEDRTGKIAAAVSANYGGALPPTKDDLRHAVELMIVSGAGLKRLKELLPLPPSIVTRLYADAHSRLNHQRVSRALSAIAEGGRTISSAAEEFGVDVAQLKATLQTQRKKEKHSSVQQIRAAVSSRTRSYSQGNRATLRKVFDLFEDGEVGEKYVEEVLDFMAKSTKTLARYVDECRERFAELQAKALGQPTAEE